jgi:hypothetical protein
MSSIRGLIRKGTSSCKLRFHKSSPAQQQQQQQQQQQALLMKALPVRVAAGAYYRAGLSAVSNQQQTCTLAISAVAYTQKVRSVKLVF